MSKLVIKNSEGIIKGYLNDQKVAIDEENLDFLFSAMEEVPIDEIIENDNKLDLLIGGNHIVIEDYNAFEKSEKYTFFKEKCQDFIIEKREKNIKKVKENSRKINRKASVSAVVKKTIITLALIGAGTITVNHIIDIQNDKLNNSDLNTIDAAYTVQVEETKTPEPIFIDEQIVETTAPPVSENALTKESFDEVVSNYARENGIDPSLLQWLLYNNNVYDYSSLGRFKILIDYMICFRDNGYNVEMLNSKYGEKSGIFAYNYSKFIIIPENIEEMTGIVQLNPSVSSSYYDYEEILNDIKSGNIPSCILVGSANSEVDFDNYVNGNLLEFILKYSLNQGINIQNVGILGYENSGRSSLINAGKILEDFPNMNVRVVNLDGFNIDNFINELNSVLNGEYTSYENEIRALLYRNAEILSIIPHTGGYGISKSRPDEALSQSMYLASKLNNVNIIATNTANYKDFPMEAYRLYVINYLAGQINKYDLINGTNYFIPDVHYNDESTSWEYDESTYADNNVINDTIYFG